MSNSVQHSLLRIRPPRVKITYDVETGDAIEKKELPFLVGVLSDLAGENAINLPDLKERSFTEIDRDNFNMVLASINPKITVKAIDTINAKEGEETIFQSIALEFNNMDDFTPGKVAQQVPALKKMLDNRKALIDITSKLDGSPEFGEVVKQIISTQEARDKVKGDLENEDAPAIKGMLEEANALDEDADFGFLKNILIELYNAVESIEAQEINDSYSFIMKIVGEIDQTASKQLDEILHAENFQTLEASWRGLNYLVFNTETSTRLKIRVIAITKKELADDLEKAVEFDQSALFKKIYENEYGTLGGTPYSCLVGDYSFGKKAPDIKLLRNISTLAAAAHAPFIAAVAPNMFGIKTFNELPTPRDLAKIFESSELVSWNGFRDSEDSRYVNLLLPRVLMRLPYGADTFPCEDFGYEESVDGTNNQKFCWGNPAFAMAKQITEAFAVYSWTAAIRGVEGGGKVENLPAYSFKTNSGDVALKCPSEVSITDRREKELSDLGFISLCHAKGRDFSVFFSAQSSQKPKKYNVAAATANAAISARLTYLLNASRFAHYIKMMMRDKIGSFASAADIQKYLQNWIADYVLLSDDGPHSLKAQYPLREAKITILDQPESPGSYKVVMFLRPHFQLEELTVSMRLVADISTVG